MFMTETNVLTLEEWVAQGTVRYGPDRRCWRFRCPVCGHVQTAEDFEPYRHLGATPGSAYEVCLGFFLPPGQRTTLHAPNAPGTPDSPCDYALFGLLRLADTTVLDEDGTEIPVFEFADR